MNTGHIFSRQNTIRIKSKSFFKASGKNSTVKLGKMTAYFSQLFLVVIFEKFLLVRETETKNVSRI